MYSTPCLQELLFPPCLLLLSSEEYLAVNVEFNRQEGRTPRIVLRCLLLEYLLHGRLTRLLQLCCDCVQHCQMFCQYRMLSGNHIHRTECFVHPAEEWTSQEYFAGALVGLLVFSLFVSSVICHIQPPLPSADA